MCSTALAATAESAGVLDANWLVLVSLVIALAGGVPGIIKVLTYLRKKPVFHYRLLNLVTGEMPTGRGSYSMVFLTGDASNAGDRPLTPACFELDVNIGGKWFNFEKALIEKGLQLGSGEVEISLDNPSSKDLQRFEGSIPAGATIRGYLMFLSKEVSRVDLQREQMTLSLRIYCVDTFGKKHRYKVAKLAKDSRRIGQLSAHPKHGLKITRKGSDLGTEATDTEEAGE